MKFSYNWISELVDGLGASASELSRLITMKTAESEGVEPFGEHLERVRAARILAVETIPGSKNRKALIDTGGDRKTVVCGAPNCREGIVTAYVPPGTKLGGKEIGIARFGEIVSEGMLASGAEVGLNRDAVGILELDTEPGTALPCAPDSIIEIDNKSLTHRPDLWGHYGMAREVAAITGATLRDPVKKQTLNGASPIKVSIEDFELCPRYSALAVDGVEVGDSPLWIQYRLESVGLNPISNVVDITNWVMAELAQPMHAFDAEKLKGDTIYVRSARAGEKLHALNGETYELTPSNLVIADAGGPIALAGVIGGMESAIGPGTTRIVFESANFNATSVRKTSAALRLRTDASMRFEKAQDPRNTVRGIERALELLRLVSPQIQTRGGIAEQMAPLNDAPEIDLPLEWLDRKLGVSVPQTEVMRILKALEFGVTEKSAGRLTVQVPSWRATKDIAIKDDLVEEVGRMIGYASIPPQAPSLPVTVPPRNLQREYHHTVRQMVAAQGFTEVYNYSFLSEDAARRFGMDPDLHVRVTNPIAAGQSLMRMSLLPELWKNITENSRFFDSFRLFEIGREIHARTDDLPDEVNHLAASVFAKDDGIAGLFELKRLAECLAPNAETRPVAARKYEHPARTAEIVIGERAVGRLFELHPSLVESGRAAVLDINLDLLELIAKQEPAYRPVRRFPSSGFDLSVVAGIRDLVGDIGKRLSALAPPEVEAVEFVRQYAGPPLPEGKRSISFRLTVAAPDRTLSSEEVGAIRARLIEGLRQSGYDLRA